MHAKRAASAHGVCPSLNNKFITSTDHFFSFCISRSALHYSTVQQPHCQNVCDHIIKRTLLNGQQIYRKEKRNRKNYTQKPYNNLSYLLAMGCVSRVFRIRWETNVYVMPFENATWPVVQHQIHLVNRIPKWNMWKEMNLENIITYPTIIYMDKHTKCGCRFCSR